MNKIHSIPGLTKPLSGRPELDVGRTAGLIPDPFPLAGFKLVPIKDFETVEPQLSIMSFVVMNSAGND